MQNKKWLTMLLALVVSVGLWLYVVGVENPQDNREFTNIPVTFIGEDVLREDYDLLITETNVPAGITLEYFGRLTDLGKMTENKEDISVSIDVSGLREAKEHTFALKDFKITLPASVSEQSLDLQEQYPKQITVKLEKLVRRTIPVKVDARVDVVEGYLPDRMIQNYSEIIIEGPEEAVNQVEYAQAILKRENADSTITATLPYQLVGENGEPVTSDLIFSDVSEIQVTYPILLYKDVTLDVDYIPGGGATESDVEENISPATIRLSGDPAVLESIETIKLSSIDLGSLMTNNEDVIRVINIPEGCTNHSGELEAKVSVRIKNKAIRQMRISSNHFSFTGVPEGFMAEAKTSVLSIAVRAGEADINNITEDNIRVVVDFSNVNISTSGSSALTMPVKIYIDGFEGVGVIAETDHTVVVDLLPVTQ